MGVFVVSLPGREAGKQGGDILCSPGSAVAWAGRAERLLPS